MGRAKIKIDSPQKILHKRSLDENGKAQKLFASEMKRVMRRYAPVSGEDSQRVKRVWADNGDSVVETIADYVGGKVR